MQEFDAIEGTLCDFVLFGSFQYIQIICGRSSRDGVVYHIL